MVKADTAPAEASKAAGWRGGGGRGGGGRGAGDADEGGLHPDALPERGPSALNMAFGKQLQGHSSWPVATFHLLTAIVGAGVLALPHAVSWLGWALGPAAIAAFYAVTVWTLMLLVDVHQTSGGKHQRYLDAVLDIMGPRHAAALVTFQMLSMCLGAIGLLIAGAGSLQMVARYSCEYAHSKTCIDQQWIMALLFGGLQVPLSQLPNLESIWIVSAMGAACSVGYSIIGLALGASSAQGLGSAWGRPAPPFIKAMKVFEALGDVSVAYFCAMVIFEIQDTLKPTAPGGASGGMRKAVATALTVSFGLFISVSAAGYSALGDATPTSILDAKFPGAPSWIPLAANVMIALHMVSAFQLYAQPFFANTEAACHVLLACCAARRSSQKRAGSGGDTGGAPAGLPVPGGSRLERIIVRVVVRTTLVAAATLFGILVPSFSAVIGLIGGLLFWPVGVLYPTAMWAKARRPRRAVCALLIAINCVLLLVSLAATVGCVHEIVQASRTGLLAAAAKHEHGKPSGGGARR